MINIEYESNFDSLDFKLITESLNSGKVLIDDDRKSWQEFTGLLTSSASKIIALRGAGSWNGMDKVEIDNLIKNTIIPKIEAQLHNQGLVVIMHDGDVDDLKKPDIGYLVGRLLEHFGNGGKRVIFIVAQKESWHPNNLKGLNLLNAQGLQYVTYLFPDNKYPGDHNNFTQSEELVQSDKYEQWYIGASGQIAEAQLADYNSKVPKEKSRKAVLFRVKNNQDLDSELQEKLEKAKSENNEKQVSNFTRKIEQRKRIYGVHWNNEGEPAINPSEFPHLEFEFVS